MLLLTYLTPTLTSFLTKHNDQDITDKEKYKSSAKTQYNFLMNSNKEVTALHISLKISYGWSFHNLLSIVEGQQEIFDFNGIINTVQYDKKLYMNEKLYYKMHYLINHVILWGSGYQVFDCIGRMGDMDSIEKRIDGWYLLKYYLDRNNCPNMQYKNAFKRIKRHGMVKRIVRIVGPNQVKLNVKYEYVIKTKIHCYKDRSNEWIIEHKIEKAVPPQNLANLQKLN